MNPRRNLPPDPLRMTFIMALRHAFIARKKEEGMTQTMLAARSGRQKSVISKVLTGKQARTNSIMAIADALDLHLELAFSDRKDRSRRFTADGVVSVLTRPADVKPFDAEAVADVGVPWSEIGNAAMSHTSRQRQRFSAASMRLAIVTALRHAFDTRKAEGGLSQARLAEICGTDRTVVSAVLAGRDWRMSTISNLAEGLGLRLEFAFVDRWKRGRRFTSRSVEHGQSPAVETACDSSSRRARSTD